MEIPGLAGNYVIVAESTGDLEVQGKSLGRIHLVRGIYFYCGSAHGPGGLRARINRHRDKDTCKFWHFDCIKEFLRIRQVWWQADEANRECEFSANLMRIPQAQIPLKGFGASDCHSKCPAHLIEFKDDVDLEAIFTGLNANRFGFNRFDMQAG